MPENKVKVAIFDFCGTFVNFQTADEYIRFASQSFLSDEQIQKSEKKRQFYLKARLIQFHDKFFASSLNKKLIVSRIKGMSLEDADKEADKFIEQKIKPAFIKETLGLLEENKKNGVYTLFVSAAYDIYLKKVVEQLGLDDYICTKLSYKKNKMSGKFKKDCIGKRKVKYAVAYLNKKFGKGNYEIVFSIGDSKSDIPVLDIAKRKVVISKEKQPWVKEGYEEIIYGA